MTAECTIDAAGPDDLPELVALLQLLFAIEQDFTPAPERQRRGLALLLDAPDRARILVARDGTGRVVGMVTAQLVVSTAEGAASAWIEDLVVAADWRGRGLGRRLLAAILEWAQAAGATRAQLLADMDNAPALAFYERLGWQPTRLSVHRAPRPSDGL